MTKQKLRWEHLTFFYFTDWLVSDDMAKETPATVTLAEQFKTFRL